jgi:hypothetical protein
MRRARLPLLCLLAATGLACGEYGGGASGSASGPQQLPSAPLSAGGVEAFEDTVYPVLRSFCVECHAGSGPGSPHISSPNSTTAYQEVVQQGKVNLAVPESSRLVQKVAGGHNCWQPEPPVPGVGNCNANANALVEQIVAWADLIDFGSGGTSIDETLASSTLRLSDGVQDVGSERYGRNLIAFYEFKEGEGTVALDTSGVAPNSHLDLEGDYEWMSGYGVQFNNGKGVGRNSLKLYDRIASPESGSGQYTVEAWITPANIVQEGPARIVTYSRSTSERNFMLGQVAYTYVFRNRALLDAINRNGEPALVTYDADEDAQDILQHVVLTYDQYRGRRIYVDARFTDDVDEQGPGRLWNWERSAPYRLVVGGDASGEDRHWEGQIRMLAIYDAALTQMQIAQNYDAGVGKRLLMRFDVSQWTAPGSFVEFQVSEFDNYSYMFCLPTYRSPTAAEFRVANIRVAVNDDIPTTGQGFRTLDTQVTSGNQQLSRQCAVIPKGPDSSTDQLTLVFEHLNGFENPLDEGEPGPLVIVPDPTPRPTRGLRDFARMNETMSRLTGVDASLTGPRQTYEELRQQLPGGFDLRSFVSSQQVGIAKLALEYCDQLVEDASLRSAFFGAFPFGGPPESVFADPANRLLLSDAFYDRMIGVGLSEAPTRQGVRDDLHALYDALLLDCTPGSPCDAERTETMVKGTCAAVLSSAAASIH